MRYILWITCFFLSSLNVKADEAGVMAELQREIEAGEFQKAYRLATQEFDLYAGKPAFDYLYGLAALNSGAKEEASFAFERVLINAPSHTTAREYFTKLHPGGERSMQSNYHLIARVGADSNINTATSNGRLFSFLPLLGDFKLPPDGKEQSDNFVRVIATADWQHALTANQSLFIAAYFEQQENLSSHTFDRSTYSAQGALNLHKDTFTLRYPILFEALYYDNQPYRFTGSAGIEYVPNNVWTEPYTFSYFANVGGLRFHRLAYKDVDFVNAGVRGYIQTPLPTIKMNADLYLGRNHSRHHRGRHHGNKNGGLLGRVSWDITSSQNILITFGYQRDDYDAPNPLYRKERMDDIFTGSLGWEWHLSPKFAWETLASYKRVDSNLSLFDHKRKVIETGLHYQF